MIQRQTKKTLKSIIVIIIIFGMVALYILPGLLAGIEKSNTPAPQAESKTFTPPVGAPSVKGPNAPPGQ